MLSPLKTTKKILIWICVYPLSPTTTTKSTKYWRMIFFLILNVLNMNGLIASAVYFLKFASTDLESALYAFFQVDTLAATAYTNIDLLLSRHQIAAIFDELVRIFHTCKYSFIFIFLKKKNSAKVFFSRMIISS